MKKIVLLALFAFFASTFCTGCASLGSTSIAERARKDLQANPEVGMPNIETIQLLWADNVELYKIRFLVELDRPGNVWSQWIKEDDPESAISGNEVYKMDEYSLIHLVVVNMQDVVKYTGSYGTAIKVSIGTESLIGYPSEPKVLSIHRDSTVPMEEWSRYFEATPLEIEIDGETFSSEPPTK